MFEINKDERMTTEEKLLFNIQEILQAMNLKINNYQEAKNFETNSKPIINNFKKKG